MDIRQEIQRDRAPRPRSQHERAGLGDTADRVADAHAVIGLTAARIGGDTGVGPAQPLQRRIGGDRGRGVKAMRAADARDESRQFIDTVQLLDVGAGFAGHFHEPGPKFRDRPFAAGRHRAGRMRGQAFIDRGRVVHLTPKPRTDIAEYLVTGTHSGRLPPRH